MQPTIAQRDNYLYVTYHHQEPGYVGAIDVTNISEGTLESLVKTDEIDWDSLIADEVQVGRRGRNGQLMDDTPAAAVLYAIALSRNIVTSSRVRPAIENEQRFLDLNGPSWNSVVRVDIATRSYATNAVYVIDTYIYALNDEIFSLINKNTFVNVGTASFDGRANFARTFEGVYVRATFTGLLGFEEVALGETASWPTRS